MSSCNFPLSRCPWREVLSGAGSPTGAAPPAASQTRLRAWFPSELSPAPSRSHDRDRNRFTGSIWGLALFVFSFYLPQMTYLGEGQCAGKGRRLKNSNSGGFCEQKEQENVLWGEICCQRFLPGDDVFSHERVPAMSSPGQGGQECLLPSYPTGQALGERCWKDKQQSPLLAKATQSPSSLAQLGSCWGSHPLIGGAAIGGSQRPLGVFPSCLDAGTAGGMTRLGVPKGIIFPAHLRPDILSGSLARLWFASHSQD